MIQVGVRSASIADDAREAWRIACALVFTLRSCRGDETVSASEPSVLESVSPIFSVADVPQALAFYRDVLGFEIGWTWGEPPTYASVCRNRVELNLGRPAEGEALSPSSAYVALSNIDAYYAGIVARGAPVTVPIGDRPYGMRDFTVADPSGNTLSFGEPTSA